MDPLAHQVLLRPGTRDLLAGSSLATFADKLRAVQARCANLDATSTAVLNAATEAGWPLTDANLTKLEEPKMTCTMIRLTSGGRVTLRGPQG